MHLVLEFVTEVFSLQLPEALLLIPTDGRMDVPRLPAPDFAQVPIHSL